MKNNYTCCPWAVPLFLLSCFLGLIQVQARTETKENKVQQLITGTVSDHQGLPLPGVNILIKGSHQGAMTNLEGEYGINASIGDTLSYSFIGYTTKILVVTQNFKGDVQLQQNADALSEVVINAGYYNTTERERTGNIAKVTAEEIELQPLVSPLQTLQGRMAGVEISPGNDLPGSAPTIRIRGQNSLRAEGNYPLYIIDGMPLNSSPLESNSNLSFTGIDPLSTLNVSNIESIEVLKDADATAIYGSRGANGVILITTKQGQSEKTEVQVQVYSGFSEVPNRIDLLHTEQYLQIRRRAFENDGTEPTQFNAYDLLVWDQERDTDWQEEILGGNAAVTNLNLTVTGGNQTTRYRLNGGFQEQGTVYPGDANYQKATGGLSVSHHSKDQKFKLQTAINSGLDNNKIVGNRSLVSSIFSLAPNAPAIFNEDGSLHWEEWIETGIDNPFNGYFNTSKIEASNLISNLSLSYELLKGLRLKTNLGYTNYNSEEIFKIPKRSYNPLYSEFLEAQSIHLLQKRNSWIVEPQLEYTTQLNKLQIESLIGSTFQKNQSRITEFTATGYVSESLIGNIAAAESLSDGRRQSTTYKYNALFARIGLNWDHKYLLNLTGRRDGSSRFGPGKRFANFGAIGAAWIFTEEGFMDHLDFLSFGKLRASYGSTGNDQIGDYGYLDAYEATPGAGGLYPVALANPDYSWEINKKLEAALQLGFLKERLNLNISWYRNRSSNQLVGLPLPGVTGFNSVQANLPATVENRGWELEFTSLNFQKKDFSWRTSVNLTFPENELVSYPNLEESPYANTYRIGEPLNIALLYQYEGINPETGFYEVADINGDGRFDYEDQVVVQNQNRQYYGGIQNQFTYKNFSLQFLWQFVKQEGRLTLFNTGSLGNSRAVVAEALTDNSTYQSISNSSESRRAYNYASASSLGYTDASFLRLKTLALNYNLPSAPLQKIGMRGAKLFLTGQNLFTFTDYQGMDPEVTNGTGASFSDLRTYSLGIQLNF